MQSDRIVELSPRAILAWLVIFVGGLIGVVSCNSPPHPNLTQSDLDAGWPAAQNEWRPTTVLRANWEDGKQLWQPRSYRELRVQPPTIPGAVFTDLDTQCMICHETYVTAFANNVHRQQGCEKCHGPSSLHLEGRGSGPESILSHNAAEQVTATGRSTTAAERAEICLQCHDTEPSTFGSTWRTSTHAHQAVACADCHTSHYNVPPGTPPTVLGANEPGRRLNESTLFTRLSQESDSLRGTSRNLAAVTPESCYRCHGEMKRFEQAVHPHQIGAPISLPPHSTAAGLAGHSGTFDCTTCHDPHGKLLPETRKDLCLKCHDGPHMNEWRGSPHDLAGIGCTDCHNPHPDTGLAMTVAQPEACYRCHSQKRQLEEIAGPHQLLGPNDFNCATCHRPHGRVTADTRTDLCLRCHEGAPTMAWHSSFHFREGVACADCHDAHPDSNSPRIAAISHTTVNRRNRRPMRVDEPATCYKCHPKILGLTSMPSRHPIQEGKMVCSDCHDAHGQDHGSLKADSLNQLCFECHAEKEGPFVWEHAPVTESCAYCHEAHGTVANNLLRQPTTFLCLRCHAGHATHNASPQCTRCHLVMGNPILVGGGPPDPTIPTTPGSRQAMFTDCTQCHSQIHGSNFASGFECGHGMRR